LNKVRSLTRGFGESFLALLACVALTGCVSNAPDPGPEMSAAQIANHYKLGAGDRVRLTVYNQPNLSNDYAVDGSGFVAIPLIGPVKAGEQTARDLEQAITKALISRGFLKNPSVAIQIIEFRPYYILGEVASPGSYPYTANLTVRKAVAAAKGYTYRANTKRVYIQRAGENIETLYELTPGTAVLPGDTIRIPERLF
jgi:protein involved in polysaccharide export with SLBB domain